MNRKGIYGIFAVLCGFVLLSCESLPIDYSQGQTWFMPEGKRAGPRTGRGTIRLLGVSVDRGGGWESVEREAAALVPLYFWEQGCRTVGADEKADFAADIRVREREYSLGWRTRRSLAVEVRIWACGESDGFDQRLPLAAGRIVSIGNTSFSSSGTTGRLLSRAIRQTVRRLPAKVKKN